MKIRLNNYLYVQKIDLLYLIESHIPVPASIYEKTKNDYINDQNKYKFVKFSKPEEINFLNTVPWLVDYDAIKDLSVEEINQIINNLKVQQETLIKRIRASRDIENINIFTEVQSIKIRIQSLTDILWYKQGNIKMNIPRKVKRK